MLNGRRERERKGLKRWGGGGGRGKGGCVPKSEAIIVRFFFGDTAHPFLFESACTFR